MPNEQDRSVSVPKRKRELAAWDVSFTPSDSEEWGYLTLTLSLKAGAAETPVEAAHVASSGLLSIFAEHLESAGIGDPHDWRILGVKKVWA